MGARHRGAGKAAYRSAAQSINYGLALVLTASEHGYRRPAISPHSR